MSLKINKINDKVLINSEYISFDQKINIINKLHSFVKVENEAEQELIKPSAKKTEIYVENKNEMNIEFYTKKINEPSFIQYFNTSQMEPEEVLHFIRFDDATDDFFSRYLN